jgi:hypothetical protein
MPDMEGYTGDAEDLGVLVERFTFAVNDDDVSEAKSAIEELKQKATNLLKDLADFEIPEAEA